MKTKQVIAADAHRGTVSIVDYDQVTCLLVQEPSTASAAEVDLTPDLARQIAASLMSWADRTLGLSQTVEARRTRKRR